MILLKPAPVMVYACPEEDVAGFLDGAVDGVVMFVQLRHAESEASVLRSDKLVHVSRALGAGCSQIR